MCGAHGRFLEEYATGKRPDADPGAVGLAQVIDECGDRTSGVPMDPEVRRLWREASGLLAPYGRSPIDTEEEKAGQIIDKIREIEAQAVAIVDEAAEQLVRLAEGSRE